MGHWKTRPDTRPGISRGGWAGAVMWWAETLEEAVYTTASVTCNWAGAEMQKPLAKYREKKRVTDGRTYGRTDGHTDGHTDGRTDIRTHPLIESLARD